MLALETENNRQPERDAIIRERQNNVIARMEQNPESAKSTIVTTGRIEEGLVCHVEQGKFAAITDLGRGMGGDAAGPSPGFYARAGIVGCVGMAIKMLAAREGLVFRKVTTTVETDFDDGALFGIGTASAAPTETRVIIEIESDEDPETIDQLVGLALEMDPWFLALRDAQMVWPKLSVTRPGLVELVG